MNGKRKLDLTNMKVLLLLAGLCCFLWGSATPAIKTGYALFQIDPTDTFSILLFAGLRFCLAGILVVAFHSIMSGKCVFPPKGSAKPIVLLALTQTIFQYLFFYVGLSRASGVHGAIITGTNVFFTILVASLIFRYEKLNARKLIGCMLGFTGIVIVNMAGAGSENLFEVSFLGEGFVLMAQLFYALSSALVKKYSKKFDVVMLSGYQFTLGGLVLTAIGFFGGGSLEGAVGISAYILLLYMGLLSAVAYTLWSVLLKHNPVSKVSIFGFMNPMFGVLLSALILGESGQALNWNTLIALVLVCMGIYVVNGGKVKAD